MLNYINENKLLVAFIFQKYFVGHSHAINGAMQVPVWYENVSGVVSCPENI